MLSNKIKPMPISKLVFYKTYQEQSPYCEKEINKMLKSKMKKYKLNLDPIIFYDKKVIITRQNQIEDYLFDYHRGFRETLQQFHKHLYIPGMNDHTNRILSRDLMVKDLTFSELYLYYDLLKKVQNAYDMRIRLLEEYLENSQVCIDMQQRKKLKRNIEEQRILQEIYSDFTKVVNETFTNVVQLNHLPMKDIFRLYNQLSKQKDSYISNEEKEQMKQELMEYQNLSSRVFSYDKDTISKNPLTKEVYQQTKTLVKKYGR